MDHPAGTEEQMSMAGEPPYRFFDAGLGQISKEIGALPGMLDARAFVGADAR